jgi:2-polyprenyl-3-methyl-5-hydroxy-6-metoxy-1,4-benzoquinol methylase
MPCALCSADRSRPWLLGVPKLGTRVPSRFRIERCEGCGLLQTRPSPSTDELRDAYGPAYTWEKTDGLLSIAEAWYRRLLVRCDQVRSILSAARLANGIDCLDVGCGDGLIIAEARGRGLRACGIDRPGAPLWPGCDPAWRTAADLEVVDQPPQSWDVISLFHVAEHLRDPLGVLARIHRWLRASGVLVIQVPNAASFQARVFGSRWYGFDIPRHLVHWTERTLTQALRQTGYEVVRKRYVSWRDNGPFLAGSLFPNLDPLIERERPLASGSARRPVSLTIRRLTYFGTVWLGTPVTLLEAAARQSAVITVFAKKAL